MGGNAKVPSVAQCRRQRVAAPMMPSQIPSARSSAAEIRRGDNLSALGPTPSLLSNRGGRVGNSGAEKRPAEMV